MLGDGVVDRTDRSVGPVRSDQRKARVEDRGRPRGVGGGEAIARRRASHAFPPGPAGRPRRGVAAIAARPRPRARRIHRAHARSRREAAAVRSRLGSRAGAGGGGGAASPARRRSGRAGLDRRPAADRIPPRRARSGAGGVHHRPGVLRPRAARGRTRARPPRARGAREPARPARRIRAGGARGSRPRTRTQAAGPGRRPLRPMCAGGIGTERAAAADADVRGAAPAPDLLPAGGRDRARRSGPARAAHPAGEAAGASAHRGPAGKRRGRGEPPSGAAAADPPPRSRTPAGEVWLSRQQLDSQQMRIEVIDEQQIASTLDEPGRIAFDDLRVAHVFAPVPGRIVRIDAAPGQQVRKGDPLLEIESPDVGAAFADLGKAEADLAGAERELKRQQELVEAQAAAQRELDQAQNAYGRARAELARARRRAELFRVRGLDGVTQRVSLRSPIDGEVIARAANPGTDVQGRLSGGAAPELFTIGSLDSVWAFADVYEADLARVKPGAPVQVKVIAYPDRSFAGRIEWISSTLDPVTRTARLRCTLGNPDRALLPEMYATVSIATPARKALIVPRSAVLHVGEERVVFVQTGTTENGLLRFQRRRVALEESEGDLVPVKSGLQAGEAVVISGALLLSGML